MPIAYPGDVYEYSFVSSRAMLLSRQQVKLFLDSTNTQKYLKAQTAGDGCSTISLHLAVESKYLQAAGLRVELPANTIIDYRQLCEEKRGVRYTGVDREPDTIRETTECHRDMMLMHTRYPFLPRATGKCLSCDFAASLRGSVVEAFSETGRTPNHGVFVYSVCSSRKSSLCKLAKLCGSPRGAQLSQTVRSFVLYPVSNFTDFNSP